MSHKIIILGGGPGGYIAAIRAAQLGAEVTLIEKDKLGGTCLNRGCIPTKALYRNAEILSTLDRCEDFGINLKGYDFNLDVIHNRKNTIIEKLVSGIEKVMKSYKIEIIQGIGKLEDDHTIQVEMKDGSTERISGDSIIIAAGSSPIIPPIPGSDNDKVMTSEQALEFDEVPKELTIIGGGVIGMEFANIFNAFGSKVTVIEALPNILGNMDLAIAKRYKAIAKKQGITVLTSTKAKQIENEQSGLQVVIEDKKGEKNIFTDKVLMSVGRKPNVKDLNLEQVGIKYSNKGIEVDQDFATNIGNIYAIGDINGKSMLAHAASHQGVMAAQHIMGQEQHAGPMIIPSCIFVAPEIASAGLTEEEAKEQGINYKVSKFMFGANGKAMTLGDDEGFVKVLASEEDIIIGVHILGPHASDLIHEGVLAIQNKLNVEQIKQTVHAHPTLSETFYEAVLGLNNEALHMVKPKR